MPSRRRSPRRLSARCASISPASAAGSIGRRLPPRSPGGKSSSGKVDGRFEMRQHAQQPGRPAAIDRAEAAVELAQGLSALRLGLGGDEIGDGLGLREVEPAVEKGAAGDLLGSASRNPIRPNTAITARRGRRRGSPWTWNSGDILAGGAVRRWKPQRQAVVDVLAGLGVREPRMPRLARPRQASGKRTQRLPGPRPAQPDDRDRRSPRRGGRGEDRVGLGARRRCPVQCFGGSCSGCSISRSTRPPFLRWVSRISSMSDCDLERVPDAFGVDHHVRPELAAIDGSRRR